MGMAIFAFVWFIGYTFLNFEARQTERNTPAQAIAGEIHVHLPLKSTPDERGIGR